MKITRGKIASTGSSPPAVSAYSAGKYIVDAEGRVTLFSQYGAEAGAIAEDIRALLI